MNEGSLAKTLYCGGRALEKDPETLRRTWNIDPNMYEDDFQRLTQDERETCAMIHGEDPRVKDDSQRRDSLARTARLGLQTAMAEGVITTTEHQQSLEALRSKATYFELVDWMVRMEQAKPALKEFWIDS